MGQTAECCVIQAVRASSSIGHYLEFYRQPTDWLQQLLAQHAFRQLVHGSEDDAHVFTRADPLGVK